MEMCNRFYCKRTGQYDRIALENLMFYQTVWEGELSVRADKENKIKKIGNFFGFGKKNENREDIDAADPAPASRTAEEGTAAGCLDDIDRVDSDWKPFVNYSDEEELYYDDSETEFDEEKETLGGAQKDKETHYKVDEEEDTAEQYAQHREDADSIGESETFDYGSGQQAEEGSEEAEGDGLFVDSGDAGDGGSTEEGGSGDEGPGGNEEAVSLTVEPEFDDEDTFEPEAEFEITEAEGLSWNRKKLRIEAEKSGARIVTDDDLMTAVTAGYIDRKKYLAKKSELAAESEDSDDDPDFLSLISKTAALPRKNGPDDLDMLPDLPEAEDDASSVRISGSAIRAILERDRNREDDFFGDIDEAETDTDDGPDSEGGGESAQIGESSDSGQEDIDAGDGNVDYDDIFQDDPGLTKKKNRKKKIRFVLKEIFKSVLIFITVFVVFIFCYLTFTVYCSRKNHVYGSSMEPTLKQDDIVRSSLLPYVFGKPQVGDIVIIDTERIGEGFSFFERIGDVLKNNSGISKMFFNGDEADILWIKRVVAVAGDTVEFIDGKFYRNGEIVEEDYIYDQTVVTYPNGEKIVVPDGCVYVMGDNRNVSQDSRSIGVVPIYALTGKKV